MMCKKNIILGFLLIISVAFFAQRERVEYLPSFDRAKIHYGFYLGLNENDYKIGLRDFSYVKDNNYNVTIESSTGFNVGLIADLMLHKNLNLRLEPGLMTNSKKIIFNNSFADVTSTPPISPLINDDREIISTYLRVPLLLKFSMDRYNNVRPFAIGGVSYNFNFSSNEANQDDNSAGQFRMKSSNFMYEVGVGIDVYLYFFKFSPSIRGIFAINNEIKYDDDPDSRWTAPINFMGTRGVFLTLAFE